MAYEIFDVTERYSGWSVFRTVRVKRPDGVIMPREIEHHGRAAAVLPYDPVRGVALLVGQYRAPVAFAGGGEELLEAPAGLIESDDPLEDARREALEETGLALRHLEPAGAVWTSPGISTEAIHLFLAEYGEADRVGPGGGLASEHEEVRLVELPLAELARLADRPDRIDLKTLALIQTLRLRRPDLFR